VLTNLNLAVRRDEKLLLVGPNGSGKSTIIKILMGIIKPDKGIIFNGINLKAGYYSQEFENFGLCERYPHPVYELIDKKMIPFQESHTHRT